MKPRWLVAVALSGFISGCQSDEDKLAALYQEQAAFVTTAHEDCEAMAASYREFREKHGVEFEELRARVAERNEDLTRRDAFDKKFGAKIAVAKEKIVAGLMKCTESEELGAALLK